MGYRLPLRRAAIAILVVGILVGQGTPAVAHDLGHRVPDGTPVTIGHFNLTATFANASAYVRTNQWDPTDLSTQVYYDGYARNVDIYDDYYGNTGWYGVWGCYNWQSYPTICKNGLVRYNLSNPPGGSYDTTEARSLACEEMGHALGLAHRGSGETSSCMSQNWGSTGYDSHDRGHINAWYS